MLLTKTDYLHQTDEALMVALSSGDKAAFNELYGRYQQRLFAYFYKMLWRNKELAEDFLQELFLKVIKNAAAFDRQRSFTTWLYSIAYNMCKNEYRKAENVKRFAHEQIVTETVASAEDLDVQQFKTAVTECLNGLSEEKKTIFLLRFNEQLTVPQISLITGLPEGTVKSKLFYLLKEMKEELMVFKDLTHYP